MNKVFATDCDVLTGEEKEKCDVVFGSIRFLSEAKIVFNVADKLSRDVRIIFCNHQEAQYNSCTHVSERLANLLILRNCKDGDDVTDIVKGILYDEILCRRS